MSHARRPQYPQIHTKTMTDVLTLWHMKFGQNHHNLGLEVEFNPYHARPGGVEDGYLTSGMFLINDKVAVSIECWKNRFDFFVLDGSTGANVLIDDGVILETADEVQIHFSKKILPTIIEILER